MIQAERSFWESELYERTYDLIVIGGGLTGQSTAHFFKKKNPKASVMVLDRGFFPIGASTRNA
ncbi:MAG TPA: FAD-dependent oxidoreductase, partial [Balneolaceae bacterium]|nr:FAD-dependent oxidoreductase [Balneolaceae bacterium]